MYLSPARLYFAQGAGRKPIALNDERVLEQHRNDCEFRSVRFAAETPAAYTHSTQYPHMSPAHVMLRGRDPECKTA